MYRKHSTTPHFLRMMARHHSPYLVRLWGKQLVVYPTVFSPRYDWTGRFGAELLPDLRGKAFLEVGSGCGIVSVAAHLLGASYIHSTDLSRAAVRNTRANLRCHRKSAFTVSHGFLFSGADRRFDYIFFNAPFHGDRAKTALELAVSDANYRTLSEFLRSAGQYLQPGGTILLGFSRSGDMARCRRLVRACGYRVEGEDRRVRLGYECTYLQLVAARDGK